MSFVDASLYKDSLNSNYKNNHLITSGDKMIKGVKAKYAHHTNINDQNIKLGSFYSPESLLIKSVTGIDFHFKGEAFSKADLTILRKKGS